MSYHSRNDITHKRPPKGGFFMGYAGNEALVSRTQTHPQRH